MNWPWAFPLIGVTGERDWAKPILALRTAYARANVHQVTYTSRRLDRKWNLVDEGAAPYSTTRRKLATLCVRFGDEMGESYTLHSHKNLLPTAENQMSYDQRELPIIGHWPSTSKMPERYDRSVCAGELLLMHTIIQRVVNGWEMAPEFHLPSTAEWHVRIGKTATWVDTQAKLGTQTTPGETSQPAPDEEMLPGAGPLTDSSGSLEDAPQDIEQTGTNLTGELANSEDAN